MHFPSTLSTLVAALSLAVGTNAWAQAADGTWVANNYIHTFNNGLRVHEACTWMNTQDHHQSSDPCAYWVDGKGTIANGRCYWKDATLREMTCFRFT
ncbi:hypothetical protein B0J13DRAFT_680976 [Dactylonectria estremocensis]|uniref:Uncharacterized protein n=1 Tax=Dactylonectria estremocensis TaxID=1079267 RepID=A0A9P9DG60_9HYPO|nr:hypothetical protein B0J13DRAFT_680976 [Dactylonectria estremocensis]